eukprot:jgi/Hompol1/1644/HPOL_001499-RA
MSSKSLPSAVDRRMFLVHSIGLIGFFGTLATAVVRQNGFAALFTWHVLGEALFVSMLVNAVSVMQGTMTRGRKQTLDLHGALQSLGLLGAAAGGAAIYINKENLGKAHLTSLHAIVGAVTVTTAILAGSWSALLKYFPGIVPPSVRKTSNQAHRLTGYVVFAGLLATLVLAISKGFIAESVGSVGIVTLYTSLALISTPLFSGVLRLAGIVKF